MHHVLIVTPQDIDENLMNWIGLARDFSSRTTKRKAHEH